MLQASLFTASGKAAPAAVANDPEKTMAARQKILDEVFDALKEEHEKLKYELVQVTHARIRR